MPSRSVLRWGGNLAIIMVVLAFIMNAISLEKSYELAKERYAELGVDADAALKRLAGVAVSMQCWQGDDVAGFESAGGLSGGGHHGHGQLSRPGPQCRRTPGRRRQGDEPDPRQAPLQPARDLLGAWRQAGGAERRSGRPISSDGWIGRPSWASAWTSTPRTFRTRRRPTASPWPIATRASAGSGSSTASPAARSARPSAAAWARRASPTSGFPTA